VFMADEENVEHTVIATTPTPGRVHMRRVSIAVAGAVVVATLGIGAALASGGNEGPVPSASYTDAPVEDSPAPSPEPSEQPPDGGSGGTGGGTGGGGTVPPPSTPPSAPPTGTMPPEDNPPNPSPPPSTPPDLDEINRRLTELDRKVDQLPTREELAAALRAMADQLSPPGRD